MNIKSWLSVGIISILFTVIIVLLGAQATGMFWKTERMLLSCQPPEFHYDINPQYCLSIIKQYRILHNDYVIIVHRGMDNDYGYYIDYPLNGEGDAEIRNTPIRWSEEGITLTTMYGDTLFIQKKNFIGGR